MVQRTIQILFALLRSAICGTKLTEEERNHYSPDILPDLLKISSKHDVAHLLVLGLKQNELIPKERGDIERYIFKAVYRYERLNYEYENLCAALEKAQIPFIPLKGSVIRQYYPEPWMRTSCDIDILIHEFDLDKTVDYLVSNLGYTYKHKFTHDVSMFAPNGVHIELHYSLMDDEPIKSSFNVLGNVWDTVIKKDNYSYLYKLPDEMFYFYHIAHMAKHFENGGCGIRAFIDIHILNHQVQFDGTKRTKLLEHGDLLMFANQANLLAEIWFGKANHTRITQKMEEYVLCGGVYGSTQNRVAIQQYKKGGKFRYAISKIWLPYDMIKYYYPILGKHKFFTPIMEFMRWIKLLCRGKLKLVTKELDYSSSITKSQMQETRKFLENIGL